jgi:hypothetical protein
MTSNLNISYDEDANFVDPTMYKELIGSLTYLVNMRAGVYYVVNTLSQVMGALHETH